MLRSTVSKAMWVGRTAAAVFGLALVLALIFGVASMAFGANGDFFKVGNTNVASATSTLVRHGVGPVLNLQADDGPPLKTNSRYKVVNLNADTLDGRDSDGLVQGRGKVYVGRLVLPAGSPNADVITVPGFATVRSLNCQGGAANATLSSFDQTRGTLSVWQDTGAADPNYLTSPSLSAWNTSLQATERTTWHLSVGTGSSAEAATIDVYTRADGTNCVYSATAQVWGR